VADGTVVQQSELDARRQQLRANVVRFRRQLSSDGETIRAEARSVVGSESPLAEHPGMLLAGSAALGFALSKAPVPNPVPAAKAAGAKATHTALDGLKAEAAIVVGDFIGALFQGSGDSGEETQGA
jgi:hypothetical protein